MTRLQFAFLLSFLVTLVAACAPQNGQPTSGPTPQVWIDAPLNGSTIPDAPYTLVFSSWVYTGFPNEFEVKINGQVETNVEPMYQSGGGASKYVYSEYVWDPPAPGTYLIEVRAEGLYGFGEPAQAQVFVSGELVAEELPDVPLEPVLIAIPNQNVNCRLGPSSTYFDIVDTLFAGTEYTPNAQGPDHLWVRFMGPVYGANCWVFIDPLQLYLNEEPVEIEDVPESLLPVVPYPPTPTPTPTETTPPLPSSTPTPSPIPPPA